jgi:glycerol-3-phosphate dehydrogenase
LRRQGGRALGFLGKAKTIGDLGPHFGAGLYGAEVDLMVREEWARTANDVLFRRTKAGLHLSLAEQAVLGGYLARAHGLGQTG